MTRLFGFLSMALIAAPAAAQTVAAPAQPVISPAPVQAPLFKTGTGDGSAIPASFVVKPPRPEIDCDTLALSRNAIVYGYYPAGQNSFSIPKQRLDKKILESALLKYRNHYCSYGRNKGPAVVVMVDFARHSNEPRLYLVDLRSGEGLDSPIRVAHGIGSDPDDDGYATVFSNVYNSYTSSLGAALGGERYIGANGLSLRLDGLEASNSQMRERDIVVHSYAPERRRYFNASLVAARGRPGSSEGCFVVEPEKRELILETLENGGFLYAGFSGQMPRPVVPTQTNVTFVSGMGPNPQPARQVFSGTVVETRDTPPIAPILQAPSTPGQ